MEGSIVDPYTMYQDSNPEFAPIWIWIRTIPQVKLSFKKQKKYYYFLVDSGFMLSNLNLSSNLELEREPK